VSGVPAARILGVTKQYGGGNAAAIRDVSFEVAPGELLTLLGPSGCGKTTTMRAIAGLEKINGGEIWLKDRLVSSVPRGLHLPPEKRDVGMVFQSYAIWPHMTVFQNVAYPLECRKLPKAEIQRRVKEGLRLVEMEDFEDRPATRLSGGQQQRVAFARAMVMEPSVLLLDEPLSNLDAKLRVQMRSHIKELQRRTGLTMVYVTHDQEEAMALSDRIIVMNGGRIEQVGGPEEIYERPQSQFVADFVGAINFIWGKVVGVQLGQNLIQVSTGRETLVCTLDGNACPAADTRVLMMLRPEKITVSEGEGTSLTNGVMNRLPADVTTNVYCGERRELSLAAPDFSLRVSAANTVSAAPGAKVRIEFKPSDLRLLPQASV
jgi:iron(III) transport system ATP-binding protein